MILLISTCQYKLHESEFVQPLTKNLSYYEIKHYTDKIDFTKYSHIIICGTALKDNEFLEHIDKFSFLKNIQIPVLGICSGMQVIGLIFDAKLKTETEIGMTEISIKKQNILFNDNFKAYDLHSNHLSNLDNFEILAESNKCVQAIKHKQKKIYGILFHPEVRNINIISNFLQI